MVIDMVVLIAGATHTGKTLLAQKLLEQYQMPYLSIDHLKMGLIRSGYTKLTPEDDAELTDYLWPVVREMVKTAIENRQNLVVEGCYIPPDWKSSFTEEYLEKLRYVCLVMSRSYIEAHFSDIHEKASAIEERLEDVIDRDALIRENEENLRSCREYGSEYILIDGEYRVELTL